MSGAPDRLDGLLADAGEELELAATAVVPDFADMLARVQRITGAADAGQLERARELNALDDDALERAANIGGLDELLHSARTQHEALAQAIERRGIAPTPMPVRGRSAHWAALAVLAAALVLALGLGLSLRADRFALAPGHDYSGASRTAIAGEWSQALLDVTPRATRSAARERASVPVPQVVAPAPVPEPAAAPVIHRAPIAASALAELDRSARAAWQRGDLAGAEASLEQLVRKGRRGALVELAYGDLFELARQRHDAGKEARLWQRYLKSFPRGRYADDARAGLCRRASGAAAVSCWRTYLAEQPRGTWREQARAAIAAVDRVTPPE